MKIIITGSSGFVGTHLSKKLAKKHSVISYDLKTGQNILDKKTLDKYMKGIDLVFHLAALINQSESWEKPEEYYITNVIGSRNVLASAVKHRVKRLIYLSSAAIYSEKPTPYGISKINAEEICNKFREKIDILILRPFNLYGPGQNPAYGYAIHRFVKQIKAGRHLSIFGDGKQTRDFLYIDDFIDILEGMITIPGHSSPIDIGTGKETRIKDLARLLGKILGKDVVLKFLPPRQEPYRSKADVKQLEKIGIDTSRFTSLEDGLRKTLNLFPK